MTLLPTITLDSLGLEYVSTERLKAAVSIDSPPSGRALIHLYSLGGSANARHLPLDMLSSPDCREFQKEFQTLDKHVWPSQGVILLDFPCYIITGCGAVVTESRQIIAETIYPTAGDASWERLLGDGINANNFDALLDTAPLVTGTTVAPLLSRWSKVYFHSVTESLVHNFLVSEAQLSGLVKFVASSQPEGAQHIALAQAHSPVELIEAPIVRVDKALVSTALYIHASMGSEFRHFVERMKVKLFCETLPLRTDAWDKIYISRSATKMRKMRNEGLLIDLLSKKGFTILTCESMSFVDQVRAFRDARLVIGPHGAGITNAAFARPDSTILELRALNRHGNTPYWGVSYLKLSSIMGFKYGLHISKNGAGEDEWDVCIEHVTSIIDRLLGN